MLPEKRWQLFLRVVVFALVIVVGAWPADSVRYAFSRVASAVTNAALGSLRFDSGVQVTLEPLPEGSVRAATDQVESDTKVLLRVPGTPAQYGYTMSMRRDAYLPLVIFLAVILALPLGVRRKLACVGVGVPIIFAVAISSVAIVVTYLLGQRANTGIPEWQRATAGFLFERWLTPPGNRVIAPLLFGSALGLAALKLRLPRRMKPPPPSTPARETPASDAEAQEAE